MSVTINMRDVATEPSWFGKKKHFELRKSLDFSATNADATNVVQVMNLKKDTLVSVFLRVTTAQGATATGDVKTDETTPQVFLDAVNLNAVGLKYGDGADGDAAALEKYIGADCVLTLVPDHNLTAAKVDVIVVGVDLRDKP